MKFCESYEITRYNLEFILTILKIFASTNKTPTPEI